MCGRCALCFGIPSVFKIIVKDLLADLLALSMFLFTHHAIIENLLYACHTVPGIVGHQMPILPEAARCSFG